MKIYCLSVQEGQEWIFPSDPNEFESFAALDGSFITTWHEPMMEILLVDEEGHKRSYSDFPWLGAHAPILTVGAAEMLEKILPRYGQLLPLSGERVLLYNVTCVLDALDEQGSKIVRFDDGGILTVEKYEFLRKVVAENEIFKLPGRSSPVFVTDDFVERVRQSGLRGVSFELVWADGDCSSPRRIDVL